MKNFYFYLMILLAIWGCKKDRSEIKPIDNYFTDLHDTLIDAQWASGENNFMLDLDKDNINDIIITNYSHYSSFAGSESYIKITPVNGYEIVFLDYIAKTWELTSTLNDTLFHNDTLMIPKVLNFGGTIILDDNYTQNPLMITYNFFPTGPGIGFSSGLNYGITGYNDYYYMAFRKVNGNIHKLAWLKAKFNGNNNGIILNSCKYADYSNILIVN